MTTLGEVIPGRSDDDGMRPTDLQDGDTIMGDGSIEHSPDMFTTAERTLVGLFRDEVKLKCDRLLADKLRETSESSAEAAQRMVNAIDQQHSIQGVCNMLLTAFTDVSRHVEFLPQHVKAVKALVLRVANKPFPTLADPGTGLMSRALQSLMLWRSGSHDQKSAFLRSRGWKFDGKGGWTDPDTGGVSDNANAMSVQVNRDVEHFRHLLNV